jgi:hypothetical protein
MAAPVVFRRLPTLIVFSLALSRVATADLADDAADGWQVINDNDPSITYSANFNRSENGQYEQGDLHAAHAIGDSCSFAFNGTGVKWIGGKNNDHGDAIVYLDGKLDQTVNSASPSWLPQQEIYSRTGLSEGPHTLKIIVKTAAYQDIDAFEVLRPAPAPKNLGHVALPPQVPYLNVKHRYPVGSGVAVAVAEPNGEWSMLFGPGYTTSNLLRSEAMTIEIDGFEQPLRMSMHRAAKTGVYYGVRTYGDLEVRLIDYTLEGAPWISRLVMIDNVSSTAAHDVRLRAKINPVPWTGVTSSLVQDAHDVRRAMSITAGPDQTEPNGQKNYENKSVVIAFADPNANAFRSGEIFTLESSIKHVAPKSSCNIPLCHYFKRDTRSDGEYLADINKLNSVAQLEASISEW